MSQDCQDTTHIDYTKNGSHKANILYLLFLPIFHLSVYSFVVMTERQDIGKGSTVAVHLL